MEIELKFKWQRKMIEEIEELSFDVVVDRLVNVAQLGDRMEHRDEWEIKYLTKHIKKRWNGMVRLVTTPVGVRSNEDKEKILKAIFDTDYRNKLLEQD